MQWAHSFNELYHQIRMRKIAFLVVFFIVVFITYGILYALDFYPEPQPTAAHTTERSTSQEMKKQDGAPIVNVQDTHADTQTNASPYPVKLIFDSLDKTVVVQNPNSTNEKQLDDALLSGPVRYPTSATLTQEGNILIFGHSSYLPTVFNKNFQAFNGIQNLKWGDTIRLESTDTEYVYRVQNVYKAKASDVTVQNTPGQSRLTLATCNVFGTKEDRFIVEADLISSHAL